MNAKQFITIAATAVLTGAGLTSAQTIVDRSGATDANNKVGSNGRNSVVNRPNPWDVSNAIVYGNVTGGKQFRGNVESTDPFAFRGNTGSRVQDNFIRDSSAVTTNGVASFNASQTKSYYGDSRAVAPPSGYTSTPGSGGYTPPTPQQWTTFDPRQQTLSAQVSTNSISNGFGTPGLADFAQTTNGLTVTPALQPQSLNSTPNSVPLSDYTNLNQNNVSSTLTTDQLTRLRQEIGQNPDQPDENGVTPANQRQGGLDNAVPSQSGDTRLNDQLQGGTVGSAALSNAVQQQQTPEPGLVTRLAGVPDTSKSTDSAIGQKSDKASRPGQAAQESADQFNAQVRAKKAADEKAKNADQPGAKDAGAKGEKPNGQAQGAKPGDKSGMNNRVAPRTVETLAGSTKAKGLSDLLTKAEGQMREGKFASAIDTYDTAESVDPKNPAIKLGRANAELGGAYYRRAEATLRQIPAADRRVLAGRYDLRGFIGDDRLQLAQKDLSDLVEKSPNDTGAAILLAYIYYNTGNERRATALLDLADKRASGKDPLVQFLKTSWSAGTEQK